MAQLLSSGELRFRRLAWGVVLLGSSFGVSSVRGQAPAATSAPNAGPNGGQSAAQTLPLLSAREIVARMLERNRERAAALEHYSTDRTYRIAYTGTGGDHQGELLVHAEYLGGEHKRLTVVSETGSPFLCDKILKKLVEDELEASAAANRMMMLTPANYDVSLLGQEMVSGVDVRDGSASAKAVKAWVIAVNPTRENKFGYVGRVWITEDDFAIARIVGDPMKPPSFWLDKPHFDALYVRRDGIWLPAKNSSTSHVRFGGEAKLSIDYGSYPEVVARTGRTPEATPLPRTASIPVSLRVH